MFWRAGNIFLKAKSPVAPKKTSASETGAVAGGLREALEAAVGMGAASFAERAWALQPAL